MNSDKKLTVEEFNRETQKFIYTTPGTIEPELFRDYCRSEFRVIVLKVQHSNGQTIGHSQPIWMG